MSLTVLALGTSFSLFVVSYKLWRKKPPKDFPYGKLFKDDERDELSDKDLSGIKYPARAHCRKFKKFFSHKKGGGGCSSSVLFLAGGINEPIKYCDQTKPFRQNRYFFYLSGVNIPGSSLIFNLSSGKLSLFLPDIDYDDVMWSGMPASPEEALETFDVDEVLYSSELENYLITLKKSFEIFTTDLDNIKSPTTRSLLHPSDPDLFYALDEARLTKDWYEVQLLKKAAQVTDKCHFAVMSATPIEKKENHLQAEFTYHAIRQGSKVQGYDPICCSGPGCSTLHYVKNDQDLDGKHSVLIDAGAEWNNYTADVTRCFPINGKFTKEHRQVYDAVLDMQTQVMRKIKPGVLWDDLHLLAHRVLIRHFLNLGIFKSDYTEDEIFDRKASLCFFPHGLGHLLGLDTHDVGGNPNYNDPDPLLQYLRLRRPLLEGMVITNEPGIYFNTFLVEEYLEKHPERLEVVDRSVMQRYMYVGGVRIEDDVLITSSGVENFTKITSDPDEIEKIVLDAIASGRNWLSPK
ncbi:LAMI_0F13102g1_1 [Lachancea mirantina]|uniref:LAMI_0F13102g1_1 n=1 Tax=Lachancea mirantina TaxID=1230905 RepID=A0A1G4K374_9SACH|nr:LAMI_0F13102g1_1 [Lachancea mirantina]